MKKLQAILLLSVFSIPLYAETATVAETMSNLVIQLAVLIIIAKFAGMLFTKIKMPSVLGELLAGVIIGPHMFGSFRLPGFEHGLFPLVEYTTGLPVSVELYGIATIASIILLFIAGMETDLALFLKFSLKGSIIGVGGVIASFFLGMYATSLWFKIPMMDPISLFMGVLSTSTSVGITARIFSDNKRMDTPEGVTILSAAVIDDVIGIILLAIIIGITAAIGESGASVEWKVILGIGLKAILVWLGSTVIGMILASRISKFLKIFKSVTTFSMLALAMAFLLSGFFEKQGLAMIIGAYVMGLTFSKTDITFAIQDELHSIYHFFVPIFFTVMGMMVDVSQLFSKEVMAFGLIFTVLAFAAKIIGCGLPALFLNFNFLGASRIGMGMVPRGEVALIISGIGLSTGILNEKLFSVSILMTLITTMIPPPFLAALIKNPKKGTRKDIKGFDTILTEYSFHSDEFRELIVSRVITSMENEGFFVNKVELDGEVYQMRMDEVFLSMSHDDQKIYFSSDKADVSFIKTVVYESILSLHETIENLKQLASPEDMRKDLVSDDSRVEFNVFKVLTKDCIITDLKGTNKTEIIKELISTLEEKKKINDKEEVFNAVMSRENSMSTGMQDGIALPHGKTDIGINSMTACLGVIKDGVDFDSIDGKPTKIIVLLVSKKTNSGPHIQFLSSISTILNDEPSRNKIIAAETSDEIWKILNDFK